jgi:hypothetical protein
MKKLLSILCLVLLSSYSYSEKLSSAPLEIMPIKDGKVTYQGIVELDPDFTDQQIFNTVKTYLYPGNLHRKFSLGDSTGMEMFSGGISGLMGTIEASAKNRTTFISEDAPRTIRVNFFQYFQGKGAGAIRTLHIDANLKIDIKNGKYRYTLSNFKWNHWNHFSGAPMSIWSTKKDCKDRGTLYQLQNLCNKATKNREKALQEIDRDIKNFIKELEEYIILEISDSISDDSW